MATSHLEPTPECNVYKNISQKGQYDVNLLKLIRLNLRITTTTAITTSNNDK
jgi:hypothetical protein